MGIIGFSNTIHAGFIIAYANAYAILFGDLYHFALFIAFITGVSIIARLLNARRLLIYNHYYRILGVCIGFALAYGLVIAGFFVNRF